MLGLGTSLERSGRQRLVRTYVKDGLKLYMPYKGADTTKGTQFVGEGSTSFDGDDYIDCGNDSSLQITGKSITVSTWFKLDGDTDWDKIVANSDGGSYEDGFTLFYQDEKLHFSINHYSTNVAINAFTDYGNWHHVVGVYDGTLSSANIKIYLDGVLGTTTDNYTTDIGNTRNTYIGAGYNSGVGDFFTGSIKNVAIWNRALTATEVQNVMYKQYNEIPTSSRLTDGLVSWWQLDG